MRMSRSRTVGAVFVAGLVAVTAGVAGVNRNWSAHASGDQEVPPRETQAQGQAIFRLSKQGDSLAYKLIAANIEGVTQAHIHCGPPGVNGPVLVFLFGLDPAGVSPNGILAEGTLTDASVIPRTATQCHGSAVTTLADVIARMDAGTAYVNVHTLTWPGGEIRADIR